MTTNPIAMRNNKNKHKLHHIFDGLNDCTAWTSRTTDALSHFVGRCERFSFAFLSSLSSFLWHCFYLEISTIKIYIIQFVGFTDKNHFFLFSFFPLCTRTPMNHSIGWIWFYHLVVEWASYNIGIFLCTRCASVHRSIGAHISKVKHLKMDRWEDSEIERMKEVGNYKARQKYEQRVPACYRRPTEHDPQ